MEHRHLRPARALWARIYRIAAHRVTRLVIWGFLGVAPLWGIYFATTEMVVPGQEAQVQMFRTVLFVLASVLTYIMLMILSMLTVIPGGLALMMAAFVAPEDLNRAALIGLSSIPLFLVYAFENKWINLYRTSR